MEYLNLQTNKEIKSKIQKRVCVPGCHAKWTNNIYETSFLEIRF